MGLNEEERRIVVGLEYEKAVTSCSRLMDCSRWDIGTISPIVYTMPFFMRCLRAHP